MILRITCRIYAPTHALNEEDYMMKKKKVIMLFPGPKYHLESLFRRRLELLSEELRGTLVTITESEDGFTCNEFEVLSVLAKRPTSLFATLSMFTSCIKVLLNAKRKGDPYDLIISYDPLKIGIIGVLLSKLFKTPLAVEVNGDFYSYANYLDIESSIRRRIKRIQLLSAQKFVLANSAGIKKLYDDQLIQLDDLLADKIIRVYPDYVDLSIFKKRPVQETSNKILFVGFPFYLKGVDILIEAFNNVRNEYPEWQLSILGWFQNPKVLEQRIENNPQIKYLQPVYFEKMPETMSQFEILVLPSRTETMGRVLLEAAAVGLARIGANIGGIPKVIDDQTDGILFEAGNTSALEKCLRQLIKDKDLRSYLVENATKSLNTKFSETSYKNNTIEFCTSVIENCRIKIQ